MHPEEIVVNEAGPEQAPLHERRRAARYPILQRCFVRPPGARQAQGWPCIAYNISTTGIGVTLPLQVELGCLLEIEAWGLPGARPLQARVVRTTPVEFLWFCGCELSSRLDADELFTWAMAPRDWLPAEVEGRRENSHESPKRGPV
jgi:hypothetical protein